MILLCGRRISRRNREVRSGRIGCYRWMSRRMLQRHWIRQQQKLCHSRHEVWQPDDSSGLQLLQRRRVMQSKWLGSKRVRTPSRAGGVCGILRGRDAVEDDGTYNVADVVAIFEPRGGAALIDGLL